jgi:hypothetical protein
MTLYYSKSTDGFYDAEIHGESIPLDAVEITTDLHASLLAAQAGGKVISADENGTPIAIDPPPLSGQIQWKNHQYAARKALDDADVTMTRIAEAVALGLTTFTATDVVAFVIYRRALRAVVMTSSGDQTQALPTKPAYPSGT